MTYLYDAAYLLALAIGWPLLLIRRIRRGPGSVALGDRLGNVQVRPVAAECVWIHGVSLGEINAARTLVEELHRRSPQTAVVVSSTTATGLVRARELFPKLTVFRFPLDLSLVLARVFDRVRPSIIVLMELEAWPNLVEVARARGVPVVIANGRATEEKTMRRLGRGPLRPIARRMFRGIRWVGAQDATYSERFVRLGVPAERVEVSGSLKYDTAQVAERIEGQDALAAAMGIDSARPMIVCGSTGPGEEERLLAVHRRLLADHPALQMTIVPRKPERFDEVAGLIARAGFACIRRSHSAQSPPAVRVAQPPPAVSHTGVTAAPSPAVFLGDTIGELRTFYALGSIAFIGRTLVPMGGSDAMEAAGLAKPVVVGPHTENFEEPTMILRESGGCVQVADDAALERQLRAWLADPAAALAAGRAGQSAVAAKRGATARTINRVLELMQDRDTNLK